MTAIDDAIDDAIAAALAAQVDRALDSHGMRVFELSPANLLQVVHRLHDAFEFTLFLDVTAVDWPGRTPRFDVVYHFYSPRHNRRVRLKLQLPEDAAEVPTLTTLYGSARYMEREAHDMYGIRFAGNADLRPILLYEGFVGHPLRKDYPIDREQPIVEYRRP